VESFWAFAVEYFGFPSVDMPFYAGSKYYAKKSHKICKIVLGTGNFGVKKDTSYRLNKNRTKVLIYTFLRRTAEYLNLISVFPINTIRFYLTYLLNRLGSLI